MPNVINISVLKLHVNAFDTLQTLHGVVVLNSLDSVLELTVHCGHV